MEEIERIWQLGLTCDGPGSRDDANRLIEVIGSARRELARLEAQMNDQVARAKAVAEDLAAEPRHAEERCLAMLQEWCSANRVELTEAGRRKFHEFPAGKAGWRKTPPHVSIPKKGLQHFIDWLKTHHFGRFIRTIEEVDKEAMLAEPETVAGWEYAGVAVRKDGEKFYVAPVGLELAPPQED